MGPHRLGDFLDDDGVPRLPLRRGGVLLDRTVVGDDGRVTFRATRSAHEATLHVRDLVVVVNGALELP